MMYRDYNSHRYLCVTILLDHCTIILTASGYKKQYKYKQKDSWSRNPRFIAVTFMWLWHTIYVSYLNLIFPAKKCIKK